LGRFQASPAEDHDVRFYTDARKSLGHLAVRYVARSWPSRCPEQGPLL